MATGQSENTMSLKDWTCSKIHLGTVRIPFSFRELSVYLIDGGFCLSVGPKPGLPGMHALAPAKDRLKGSEQWYIKNRDTGGVAYVWTLSDVLETFEAVELHEWVYEKMAIVGAVNALVPKVPEQPILVTKKYGLT